MALETKHALSDRSVNKVQELIRANIDSFDGLEDAAELITDRRVADLFRSIADERSTFASELQEWVEWNGEEAAKEGSLTARVHHAWVNVRNQLSGGDPHTVLAEAERGEDHIQCGYEDVLKETPGSRVHDLLLAQYAAIKAAHDRIRDLRDAYIKG
ncbi:MAG: PA2169 family four-helix-bundle protein [Planctomycetaceae bacterium]